MAEKPKVVTTIVKNVIEGDFKFPGAITPEQIKHAEKKVHDVWKELGGKTPLNGKIIGDQLFKGGLDPVAFIKQFDPTNTSGIFPDVLNIMTSLKQTAQNAINDAIAPLQAAMGSDLLSKLNAFSSILSSIKKTENKKDKVDEVILLIIASAMTRLTADDPEQAIIAATNLNDKEIDSISDSYYKNFDYKSDEMPVKFVVYINEAIKLVRIAKSVK